MSMSVAECHAKSVRERLRNPTNAVEDVGIDLKRPKLRVVPIVQAEPVHEEVPVECETPEQIEARQIKELNAELERLTRQKEEIERARRPKVETIQKTVCAHYGISIMDMLSERRTKILVRPRHVAMYLAKELTLQSLPQIGRRFGGRDHTTCLNAIQRIRAALLVETGLQNDIATIEERLGIRHD